MKCIWMISRGLEYALEQDYTSWRNTAEHKVKDRMMRRHNAAIRPCWIFSDAQNYNY